MNNADTQIHADLQRDVGRLEGKVDAQSGQLANVAAKLDTVCAYIEREKGARRSMIAWGSVAGGVVGSCFAAAVAWFTR